MVLDELSEYHDRLDRQFQKRDVETDNNRISLYIKKSNERTNNLFPSFTESAKNVLFDCKSLVTRREWQNRGRIQGENSGMNKYERSVYSCWIYKEFRTRKDTFANVRAKNRSNHVLLSPWDFSNFRVRRERG